MLDTRQLHTPNGWLSFLTQRGAHFIFSVLALTVALILHGCEESGDGDAPPGTAVCGVVVTLASPGGSSVGLTWAKDLPYNASNPVCQTCCNEIQEFSKNNPDYTSLCAAAESLEQGGNSMSAGALHQTCSGCPDMPMPPPEAADLCAPCAAGKSNIVGRGVCDDCPPGRWSGFGFTECLPCQGGRYSTNASAVSPDTCLLCDAGEWSPAGATFCSQCVAGRWSVADTADCFLCGAGKWSAALGATSDTVCALCAAGKFSTTLGAGSSSTCLDCAPGRWNPDTGAPSANDCQPCSAGSWSDSPGAISNATCTSCGVGTWSSTVGASSAFACTACEAGTWSSTVGAASTGACEKCEEGRYSPTLGAVSNSTCLRCPNGTFGSIPGLAECPACGAGAYSEEGATSCSICDPGYFQEEQRASRCEACAAGTSNEVSGAKLSTACVPCAKGTFSGEGAAACTACAPGKYAESEGLVSCRNCDPASVSPEGAHSCCPHDGDHWPVKTAPALSIPPGKHWTDAYLMNDGNCEPGGENDATKLEPESKATSPILYDNDIYVSTFKQGVVHSCLNFRCQGARCGVLPPEMERLQSGIELEVAAFIGRDGFADGHKCEQTVEVGFAGFGCEPNTILSFLLALVGVVTMTILLGILFESCVRSRRTWFLETTLKVTPPAGGFPVFPKTSNLQSDVQAIIGPDGDRKANPAVADIHAWTAELQEDIDGKKTTKVASVNVDLKLSVPRAKLRDFQKWLQGRQWVAGPGWTDPNVTIEQQPPARIMEAAKLPGADLLEGIEMATVRTLSCLKVPTQPDEIRKLHMQTAREVLSEFMQKRTVMIIGAQQVANWLMIIIIPSIGFVRMTCADGYPVGLHLVWVLYVFLSSLLTLWLLLRNSPPATRRFLSMFRIRLALRFGALVVSVTDLYQDATFPVIAGRCGFDLWWVSLWLVFLGVGVMQVIVQIILLYGIRRRYLRARTPEERERAYIEGIFMALRGCDNHVLVYLIKPAVEERLGGGSSWSMKTMEARVAFLRFVFEDAEQSALQMSFLFFFDQATTIDKIWVGLSTGTSLLLSFTLTVQTLAEVRDWLWFQLLSWFPGGARWPEARILWLLFLIFLYRGISIFPWLGSCTPAGDHNASTLRRLLLSGENKVPYRIVEETFIGSGAAYGVSILIVIIACVIWREPLRLPRDIFIRFRCCCKRNKPRAGIFAPDYDFDRRLEVAADLGIKKERDEDSWLESLRYLHATAKKASCDQGVDLLADLDDQVFHITHSTGIDSVVSVQEHSDIVEEVLTEIEKVGIPEPSDPKLPKVADVMKVLRTTVKENVDSAIVRGKSLQLLSDRDFRRAGLCKKAELIDEVTNGKAPLLLLHWSVLEHLGELPAFGSNPGAEDVPTALKRCDHTGEQGMLTVYLSHIWARPNHPDTTQHEKAKILVFFAQWLKNWAAQQQMNCEVFFWVDYCCMDPGLDIGLAALPLFIATSSQILMWRTEDFERKRWTMVERLLAYSFCPGGMTPFAVSSSSFSVEAKDVKKSGSVSDDDLVVEDLDKPVAGVSGKAPTKPARVVPIIAAGGAAEWCPDVHRRARKLPDPLDSEICKPSGLAAESLQRRRVQQLVETALAVPALETFADRQPVDFGLTEVIEQFLGAMKPLDRGDGGPVDVEGTWLRSEAATRQVRDWQLTVKNVKAPTGDDGGAGKKFRARPLEQEGVIELLDRIDDDSKAAPPAPPKVEDINQCFEDMDNAYEAQVSGTAAVNLEEPAVKLVETLRADLAAAEASGDEKFLREALLRTRHVELPVKERLTKKLCQLQLTNAIAAKDLMSIQMAMRYARQHELQDLQEYEDAQAAKVQFQKEKLQERALALLDQETPDVAAIVSVVDIAKRRGWTDIADSALEALKKEMQTWKDAAGIARLARVHRLANEQHIHAVVVMSTEALTNLHEEAVSNKDADVLCNLIKAADSEGCADIADPEREALRQLIGHWRSHWQEKHRNEASDALGEILEAAQSCTLGDMVDEITDTIEQCKQFEAAQQAEARKRLQPPATAKSLAEASKMAAQWAWSDITREVVQAFKRKIDAAAAGASKNGVQAIVSLAEICDAAEELGLTEVTDDAGPAISKIIDVQRSDANAIMLLDTARALEARGFRSSAGQARQALQEVVGGLKSSDGADAAAMLARLHDKAESCSDSEALGLADGAIGEIKGREDEKRDKLRDDMSSASDSAAVVGLIDLANYNGWTEIADSGFALLRTKIADSVALGGLAGFSDVAKARSAAKTLRDHRIVELTGAALNARMTEAQDAGDSVPLLEIARALDSEDCGELAGVARLALKHMIASWKDGPLSSPPFSSQALLDFAQSCGEDDIARSVRQIIDLAKRKQNAKASLDANVLAELVRDAAQTGCRALQQEMLRELRDVVTDLKAEMDVDGLRAARDSARRCNINDIAHEADNVLKLANELEAAKAGNDFEGVVEAITDAGMLGCDAFAADGRAYLVEFVKQLQKDLKLPGKLQILNDVHATAKAAGLDDIADRAVEAVGGSLPKDWAKGGKGVKSLTKAAATDKQLIDRIQQMVDSTYRTWGTKKVTMDRIKKSKNPLGSRLKVEEVIHVENAENYLNYSMRRDEVAKAFQALPAAERRTDFDLKTQHVSLKGVWRHPEEPLDLQTNEAWMWHGTSPAGAAGITDTDFAMKMAGSATGTMLGRGLYFAESCLKSDEYTKTDDRNWCPLLLCRVVLGRILYVDAKYPHTIADTLEAACLSGEYHSVLGDREKVRGSFREYVVFDNDQVYPEYIVWYSRQPPYEDY